jgi:hypothetical protein
MNPWMNGIGYAMELQDHNPAVSCVGDHILKMLERPVWIGVAGGRNQAAMMPFDIVSRANNRRS